MDDERARGKIRGPFHGISMLIKDNIMAEASLGVDTTCGSLALKGVKVKRNAAVENSILNGGIIIIGKTNLSEWAGKNEGSAKEDRFFGRSIQSPAGSSTGSAVGVSAGFAPVSGTETNGSIVQPSGRSGVHTCPDGNSDGQTFDPQPHYKLENPTSGFVDLELGYFSSVEDDEVPELTARMRREIANAANRIEAKGAKVVQNAVLLQYDDFDLDGYDGLEGIWDHDFATELEKFLAAYKDTSISSVADLVQFNNDHANVELPPGTIIHVVDQFMSDESCERAKTHMRDKAGRQGFDKVFSEHGVDVLVTPQDCQVSTIAAMAGYPIEIAPLGHAEFNDRGFRMLVVASRKG
ncbi:hypothetical protein QQS21_008858 [Conoideocrella luteorostrata]|uniref:Amidase domain-containing protein n=1 Tax=Conoideocrella luteorostrata TaxID=1105319 RepID=A0AAJ0FQT9_9HYPO|nr:hypothetical protein QQS21_008858 [Conoideocrella luteorostrata]